MWMPPSPPEMVGFWKNSESAMKANASVISAKYRPWTRTAMKPMMLPAGTAANGPRTIAIHIGRCAPWTRCAVVNAAIPMNAV